MVLIPAGKFVMGTPELVPVDSKEFEKKIMVGQVVFRARARRVEKMSEILYIEPEVAGGLGENTILDRNVQPSRVRELQYQFDGWLGDVLIESSPVFIATQAAKTELERRKFTGIVFDDVEVSVSDQFRELNPNVKLPAFVWLRPGDRPGLDDFGVATDGRLVISSPVLELFKRLGIVNALISPFDN